MDACHVSEYALYKNVKFGRDFLTTNEEFRYAKSPNFTNVKGGCSGAVLLYFVREEPVVY